MELIIKISNCILIDKSIKKDKIHTTQAPMPKNTIIIPGIINSAIIKISPTINQTNFGFKKVLVSIFNSFIIIILFNK